MDVLLAANQAIIDIVVISNSNIIIVVVSIVSVLHKQKNLSIKM